MHTLFAFAEASRHARFTSNRRLSKRATWLGLVLFIRVASAQTLLESIPARWGQASALVDSLFVVQGGKTQGSTGGAYTYGSAPSDSRMYTLDLSSTFPLSSPPWQSAAVQTSDNFAPAVSFHTISPLNSTSLLLFGGDASPIVPIQTNNDSAFIVHLGGSADNRTVAYHTVPTTWNQPMRSIYHTSEADTHGSVWIVGGEKADGSGIVLDQQWSLNSNDPSPSFQLLSSSPPASIVGSTSTLLSDGTLLLLGGMDRSGQLQSMQNLYAYSTNSKEWAQTSTQAAQNSTPLTPAFPAPRRDHIAVSLPNQRVFIQGGASADLSTVYSDAWILDWSLNPPIWTMLNSTAGPGPRFGHSAVAYGSQIVISFGWAGANAAPTGVSVFDASTLSTSSNMGGSQGGSWSTTSYTPDLQMSRPSPTTGSAPSTGSSSGGNGSSSSSGSTDNGSSTGNPESGNGGGRSSTNSANSGSFPTGNNSHGDDGSPNSSGGGGTSDGTKAGAAIGAILGAGLVVGAGYAAYRRRSLNNYRRYGTAPVGMFSLGARHDGPCDDDFLMEKAFVQSDYDRPYHRADGGAGLTGGFAYGRKRSRQGSPWNAGILGHAMEGSGPHLRERLAILAGRGKRDAQIPPRFDMLADEGDGNSVLRPLGVDEPRQEYDNKELEQAESPLWHDQQLREHDYVHVDDQDLSDGDLGRLEQEYETDDLDVYSPFEDRPQHSQSSRTLFSMAAAGVSAQGYGKIADRQVDDDSEGRHSDDGRSDYDTHDGPSSGPSLQSHSTTSRSNALSLSKSNDILSPGGIVSFSDASHSRRGASNTIKRSPTWWGRFVGNSLLERSASGRLLTGPNASLPIRDPAPPPTSGLEAITESPRSRQVSESQDPFSDPTATAQIHPAFDEMGRRIGSSAEVGEMQPYSCSSHGRSLSSIGSARTGASSHFESRVRGMDVIQRVRTASSRRTQSSRAGSNMSDTDSEPALSRRPTLLKPRNVDAVQAETPGSVVWDPQDWQPSMSGNGLEDLVEENVEDVTAEVGLGVKGDREGASRSNVSETPSITPLTTKRARLNPVMVSPLFPSPSPRLTAPPTTIVGTSVRDKVKAFESATVDSNPVSAWTASLSSTKSIPPPDTPDPSPPRPISSSPNSVSRAKKTVYTHGLAPKPLLYVANPDVNHPSGPSIP